MGRIGGVGLARGLAVIGMMTGHVGAHGSHLWSTRPRDDRARGVTIR